MRFLPFPEGWPRRETYAHYRCHPCSYSVTQTVDVTALKQGPVPFAPALIHAICRVANRLPALRMTEQAGEVGHWEEIWPAYTVFHPDSETFSVLWTEYHPDFEVFLERYRADVEQYGDQAAFFPKGPSPAHALNISIAPWLDFTAFNLDYGREYLCLFSRWGATGSRRAACCCHWRCRPTMWRVTAGMWRSFSRGWGRRRPESKLRS